MARTLLIQLVTVSTLSLQDVESAVGTEDKHTVIRATLAAHERTDSQVEQIASRLTLERISLAVRGAHFRPRRSNRKPHETLAREIFALR
jgi:hypothetical protein